MKVADPGSGPAEEEVMGATIVVGLDGSSGSQQALGWAARLGARNDAVVQPVLAWEYPALALLPFPAGVPVPPQEAMQADAEVRAQGLVEGTSVLAELGDAVEIAEPLVRQGSAGRVLCEAAESADLLALGSRGLGAVKGVLLGSVSAHCASAAPCPVALIPDGEEVPERELVVVGVDGSPLSDEAVRWADRWAGPTSRVLVVHVWDVPITMDAAAANIDSEALEEASTVLVEEAAKLVTDHKVETLRIRGDARVELAKLAHKADMLVIGARGHTLLERFLMGSVASHAVHHLVAPTVIVRTPDA